LIELGLLLSQTLGFLAAQRVEGIAQCQEKP
jgi:hypothetical protein